MKNIITTAFLMLSLSINAQNNCNCGTTIKVTPETFLKVTVHLLNNRNTTHVSYTFNEIVEKH